MSYMPFDSDFIKDTFTISVNGVMFGISRIQAQEESFHIFFMDLEEGKPETAIVVDKNQLKAIAETVNTMLSVC